MYPHTDEVDGMGSHKALLVVALPFRVPYNYLIARNLPVDCQLLCELMFFLQERDNICWQLGREFWIWGEGHIEFRGGFP